MAYQLYKKMAKGSKCMLQSTEISIAKTSFGLGYAIVEDFKDYEYVEVYFDRECNKLGLKPTRNPVTGYRIQHKGSQKTAYVVAKVLTETLPKGRYTAIKEDDMWVIDVPETLTEDNLIKSI